MLQASQVTGATFPTPEAQCLHDIEVEFAVECHQAGERFQLSVVPKPSRCHLQLFRLPKQEGSVAATGSLFNHPALNLPQVCPTAFKVAENEEGYVLRYYNMSQENIRVSENNKLFLTCWNAHTQSIQAIGTTRNSYRIHSKEEINFKRKHKQKGGAKSKNQILIRSFLQVKAMTIATIDIGGTGIKFASLTPDGKILDKTSTPTPETLEDLLVWLTNACQNRTISGIAMSVPGAVNQETGVIEGLVPFLISMVFHGMRPLLITSYLST